MKVLSGGITGTPDALPTDWSLTDGYLLGPGADLKGGTLDHSVLAGDDLVGANLVGANLGDADLNDVDLAQANLTSTRLGMASIIGLMSGAVVGTPASLPSRPRSLTDTSSAPASISLPPRSPRRSSRTLTSQMPTSPVRSSPT